MGEDKKTEIVEENILIATRQPPGDNWRLIDSVDDTLYASLTDTLEASFQKTGFKGEYRLAPLDSKLYMIQTEEHTPVEAPPKVYSLYGEFTQGV